MRFLLMSVKSAWLATLLLLLIATPVLAQSQDITAPVPVRTSNLAGGIAPRDLGDSRLTNHYYTFAARPGDLTVTIESRNLNGDFDVFTARTLRPLLKFTVYAEIDTTITKTVFLRTGEDLILRVQARTPNDDEGIYHVRFGATFEPVAGAELFEEVETTEPEKPTLSERRGGRVSSVGARIEEPKPPPTEVAAATPEPTPDEAAPATPKPTPEEIAVATPEPTPEVGPEPKETEDPAAQPESAKETPEAIAETPTPRRTPRTRGRRPITRLPTQPVPTDEEVPTKEEIKPAGEPEEKAELKVDEAAVEKAEAPARRTARGRRAPTAQPTPPEVEPEPQIGPRLIIETRAGERIERFMSTIRRVTVERNQIVVVGRDGKIERTLLSDVIRMSIEP